MKPISYDYRISNLCNFKCRMCGDQLSSSWESERRQMKNWTPEGDPWMTPENRTKLQTFTKEVSEGSCGTINCVNPVVELKLSVTPVVKAEPPFEVVI